MRLTDRDRNNFVNAVFDRFLHHIGLLKHDSMEARKVQVQALCVDAALADAPQELRKIWENDDLRQYVRTRTFWVAGIEVTVPVGAVLTRRGVSFEDLFDIVCSQQVAEYRAYANFFTVRDELKDLAFSAFTTKQLKESLPCFTKLLPTGAVIPEEIVFALEVYMHEWSPKL